MTVLSPRTRPARQELAQRGRCSTARSSARRATRPPPASACRAMQAVVPKPLGGADARDPPPPPGAAASAVAAVPPVPPPPAPPSAGSTAAADVPPPGAPPAPAVGAAGPPAAGTLGAGRCRRRETRCRTRAGRRAQREQVAVGDVARFASGCRYSHPVEWPACAGDPLERVADAVVRPGEIDVRAERQQHQRRPIGEREPRRRTARPPAATWRALPRLERVLIDDEHEQPADAAAFVRADRRRPRAAAPGRRWTAAGVDELGGDDPPRLAGHGDGEVAGVRPRNGRPCRSTTPTSTVTSSTPLRNDGV